MDKKEALRKVQLAETDILVDFAALCDKFGLKYYLAYGTLIGAVRHKGFVPWDDDIDLFMPRKDYERFLSLAGENLPSCYFVNHYTSKGYDFYGSNLRLENKNVQFAAPFGEKVTWQNVWIDIIPMDGLPSSSLGRRLRFLAFRLNTIRLRFAVTSRIGVADNPSRSLSGRIAAFLSCKLGLGRIFTIKGSQKRIDRTKMLSDYDKSDFVHGWVFAYKEKCLYHRKQFGEGVTLDFEGHKFRAPSDYDGVLRQVYGDYMVLPPEEKRIWSHCVDFRES